MFETGYKTTGLVVVQQSQVGKGIFLAHMLNDRLIAQHRVVHVFQVERPGWCRRFVALKTDTEFESLGNIIKALPQGTRSLKIHVSQGTEVHYILPQDRARCMLELIAYYHGEPGAVGLCGPYSETSP